MVIAILGVLSSVAIPNVVGLMGTGDEAAATAERGSVALAVSVYAYQNDGAIPDDVAALVAAGLFQQQPQFDWIINDNGTVEPAEGNPIY